MEILELIKTEYLSIIFGGLGGIGTAFLTQKMLNKRGVFSYYVHHNRVGISTNDSIFGNVLVTWNENPIDHLYLSNIDLKNESLNDYENIVIRTYTNDTKLLSESTQIVDTPNILQWTKSYSEQLHVEPEHEPTQAQRNIYQSQREYLIPVLNRGQEIRITYLNSAISSEIPNIWLSATIKGVKIKFQVPQNQVYGIPQPRAVLVGTIVGFILLVPLVLFVKTTWIVALISILYGLLVVIPGVFIIKAYRKIRELIGG